jgi:K(+)-stimulated pyrophosphate-energized sodium pump
MRSLVYELSLIENIPDIEKDFGFKLSFSKSKMLLEKNDGVGNTFKATAKPVFIVELLSWMRSPRDIR